MKIFRIEKESPAETYRIVVKEGENRGVSKQRFQIVAEDLTKEVAKDLFKTINHKYRRSKLYTSEM